MIDELTACLCYLQVRARSEDDADDELEAVVVLKHGKKVVCGAQSGVLNIFSWGQFADCSDRCPGVLSPSLHFPPLTRSGQHTITAGQQAAFCHSQPSADRQFCNCLGTGRQRANSPVQMTEGLIIGPINFSILFSVEIGQRCGNVQHQQHAGKLSSRLETSIL